MLCFILLRAILLKCHSGAHLHGNLSASDISTATSQPMGEGVSLDTGILLCNSVADVICVIFIAIHAMTSVKIFGSTDV